MDTEKFWKGPFGDEYISRNKSGLESAIAFFAKVLPPIKSAVELGANIGTNLRAIRTLLPEAHLSGVEINPVAAAVLRSHSECFEQSLLQWEPKRTWDLAFTCGVLIHIPPEHLAKAYQQLFRSSSRYVLISEYYNPTPVALNYRGHDAKMWKRDFAGEMLDSLALRLLDYGFVYYRDPFPLGDVTWFLMEKTA